MAQYRCTQCGDIIDVPDDLRIGKCQTCGSLFVLPNYFPQKQALYRKAADMRESGNYTAACNYYNRILEMDANETEANWGYLLSKYGIEQINREGRYDHFIFHRVELKAFRQDPAYDIMIQHCPKEAVSYYERLSKEIEDRQSRLLALRRELGTYDVFLHCSSMQGSVGYQLAVEVYKTLADAGYQVFLPCVMLNDESEEDRNLYEMAVADIAKVMIVVAGPETDFTTKALQAPWKYVFDQRQIDSRRKILAVYRDIRPESLPLELAQLQDIDCGVPDFREEVLANINQLFGRRMRDQNINKTIIEYTHKADDLLKKGKYSIAREYYQNILKLDPEIAYAYWGIFCCMTQNLRVPSTDAELDINYQRAIQFADEGDRNIWLNEARDLMSDAVWNDLMYTTDQLTNTSIEGREDVEKLAERVELYTRKDSPRLGEIEQWRNLAIRDRKVQTLFKGYEERDVAVQPLFGDQIIAEEQLIGKGQLNNYKSGGLCIPDLAAIALFLSGILLHVYGYISDKTISMYFLGALMNTMAFLLLTYSVNRIIKGFRWREENNEDRKNLVLFVIGIIAVLIFLSSFPYGVQIGLLLAVISFVTLIIQKLSDLVLRGSVIDAKKEKEEIIAKLKEIDIKLQESYLKSIEEINDAMDTSGRTFPDYQVKHNEKIMDLFESSEGIAVKNEALYSVVTMAAAVFICFMVVLISNRTYAGPWHDIEEVYLLPDRTVGLRTDGTVTVAGFRGNKISETAKWTDIIDIAGGNSFIAGLTSDGRVEVATNYTAFSSVSEWTDVIQISATYEYAEFLLGLKSDGTVYYAGRESESNQGDVSEWTNIVKVYASYSNDGAMSIGIREDGTVVCTDENYQGLFNSLEDMDFSVNNIYGSSGSLIVENPSGICLHVGNSPDEIHDSIYSWYKEGFRNPEDVYVLNTVVILWQDGTITGAGTNEIDWDKVNSWTDIIEIEGSNDPNIFALKDDGTVLALGINSYDQLDANNWKNIIHIQSMDTPARYGRLVGIKTDQSVVAVGNDKYGCLYISPRGPLQLIRFWLNL